MFIKTMRKKMKRTAMSRGRMPRRTNNRTKHLRTLGSLRATNLICLEGQKIKHRRGTTRR
jgi:hypothetical protein